MALGAHIAQYFSHREIVMYPEWGACPRNVTLHLQRGTIHFLYPFKGIPPGIVVVPNTPRKGELGTAAHRHCTIHWTGDTGHCRECTAMGTRVYRTKVTPCIVIAPEHATLGAKVHWTKARPGIAIAQRKTWREVQV
jgi:hypothetical protein